MDVKNVLQSKNVQVGALLLGCFLIALIAFAGGVAVGIHKARFSYTWGQNYERNFTGPAQGFERGGFGMMPMMRDFDSRDFRNGHGLAGDIVSLSGSSLVVKDRYNKENSVTLSDRTLIKYRGEDLKLSDLKAGDSVVIIGKPGNNGVVEADIVRVFDRAVNQNAAPATPTVSPSVP